MLLFLPDNILDCKRRPTKENVGKFEENYSKSGQEPETNTV